MRHSMGPLRRQPPARGTAWVLLALLLAEPFAPSAAAASPAAVPAAASKAKTAEGRRPALPAGRKAEFVSALILWLAIVAVGLALLVMVMMLGRRLRRAVRRQPSGPTVPDPLWYLKKSPSAVTPGDSVDRANERETGQGSDGRSTP